MEVISDFQQHIIIYVFNSTKNYLLHFVCEFRSQNTANRVRRRDLLTQEFYISELVKNGLFSLPLHYQKQQ